MKGGSPDKLNQGISILKFYTVSGHLYYIIYYILEGSLKWDQRLPPFLYGNNRCHRKRTMTFSMLADSIILWVGKET